MSYTHRNGETEPPTVEGYYWFHGDEESREYCYTSGMVYAASDRPGADVDIAWGALNTIDEHGTKAMEGRWWGPVTPPWEDAP